jgi:DNA-binding XRE family transcriptional regulator
VDLENYLKEQQILKQDFAKRIHVSRSCISHIINKRREPSLEVARRIIKETKGKVNVADLFKKESPLRFVIKEFINEQN